MTAPHRSALAEALARVGDRWTLLLVDALLEGPARFGDLQEALSGIAPNILSHRLKRLGADGLVVSRLYSKRPPRSEYMLTAPGRELADALRLLAHWGAQRGQEDDGPRHQACGTPVEARWYCPTCARLTDEEPSDLRYV